MTGKDKFHGNIVHGANSGTIRKRFDDKRTGQGRQLSIAMKSLTDHFGAENITAPMQILLDANIRPKIVTMILISEYINTQETLVSPTGELPPVLAKNYIAFSNALRRDLESLCLMARNEGGKKIRPPRLSELIT